MPTIARRLETPLTSMQLQQYIEIMAHMNYHMVFATASETLECAACHEEDWRVWCLGRDLDERLIVEHAKSAEEGQFHNHRIY